MKQASKHRPIGHTETRLQTDSRWRFKLIPVGQRVGVMDGTFWLYVIYLKQIDNQLAINRQSIVKRTAVGEQEGSWCIIS